MRSNDRTRIQVDRYVYLVIDDLLQVRERVAGRTWQLLDPKIDGRRRADPLLQLPRHQVVGRTEWFVALEEDPERPRQRIKLEWPQEAQDDSHVVRGELTVNAVEKPDPALRERGRKQLSRCPNLRRSRHPRPTLPAKPLGHLRHAAHGCGVLEDSSEGDVSLKGFADPRDQLGCLERVSPEKEEVLVQRHSVQA